MLLYRLVDRRYKHALSGVRYHLRKNAKSAMGPAPEITMSDLDARKREYERPSDVLNQLVETTGEEEAMFEIACAGFGDSKTTTEEVKRVAVARLKYL